jgi:hypothetical protein
MSCVLRAIGAAFDVDAFLADSGLQAETVFHRGAAKLPGSPDGAKWSASGFNVAVSDDGGLDDLPLQVRDASRFLNQHEDELRRLGGFPGVEEVCLDFGIRRRDVAMQTDVFPADLLWPKRSRDRAAGLQDGRGTASRLAPSRTERPLGSLRAREPGGSAPGYDGGPCASARSPSPRRRG